MITRIMERNAQQSEGTQAGFFFVWRAYGAQETQQPLVALTQAITVTALSEPVQPTG